VSEARRESVADRLIVLSAGALFLSLFLTWSHQFSMAFITRAGAAVQLHGVAPSPTAWQVYSVADLLLALLAGALLWVALIGGRVARVIALLAALLGLAFTIHALAAPPTNGVNVADPALGTGYAPASPSAGGGEIVAIAALALAIAGLGLSFTAD
jgi:hypothetical protein